LTRNRLSIAIFIPVLSLLWTSPLFSDNTYEFTYRTKIGKSDRINPRGIHLHNLGSILRQDRTNLYDHGGDPGDMRDPIYYDPVARSTIEYARILPVGCTYQELKKSLLNEEPYIEVGKKGNELYIKPLKNEPLDFSSNASESTQQTSSQIVYRARLSYRDHYNFRGKLLGTIGAILRQDRVNYYKFGGDIEDTPDYFFRKKDSLGMLEHSKIIPIDISYDELRRDIAENTPLVEVRSSGNETYLKILEQ